MNRIVAITGMMRSGTSLVASIVHRLGFQVSPVIPAPAPPSWRSDWEDPELTSAMIRHETIDWENYFARRRRSAEVTGFRGIAIKSPYLALHHDKGLAKHGCFWIVVRRDEDARLASYANYPQLDNIDNASIGMALERLEPDSIIQYEDLLESATFMVSLLAGRLDVNDPDAIDASISLVGKPTEYDICPQL